ncbi:universal stress protein [Halalkalicoccus sp. NIPERK01]|uniref:universal stress protein n=1 Tax=Halalkalicoccus sp. NIPERK01 TaxID=3053469 RepID=UPI00256F3E2B|nr:universal stress protein [Halalkalicoccus sp. NIPERK01]MDL5360658.1 universal stress protein [Halalkalicoccus sp. NIPERK01]
MFEDILVPTDGSESARRAEGYAIDMAGEYRSTVHVLHVVDPAGLGTASGIEPRGEEARGIVDAAVERIADGGVRAIPVVRTGVVPATVLEYVDEAAIGLILMGTHGRSGLERSLLGSVTKRIVRASHVPVVTVGDDEGTPARYPYRRLLVATDGSEAAAGAAEVGIDVARTYGAGVHVLSVVHSRGSRDAAERIAAAHAAVADVERMAAAAGVEDVSTAVEYGLPHAAVLAYAGRNGIDLVVMGAYGRTGVRRYVLGSVAERVVRTSPIPVLTVRPRDSTSRHKRNNK